jgi:hypothetical protein
MGGIARDAGAVDTVDLFTPDDFLLYFLDIDTNQLQLIQNYELTLVLKFHPTHLHLIRAKQGCQRGMLGCSTFLSSINVLFNSNLCLTFKR